MNSAFVMVRAQTLPARLNLRPTIHHGCRVDVFAALPPRSACEWLETASFRISGWLLVATCALDPVLHTLSQEMA